MARPRPDTTTYDASQLITERKFIVGYTLDGLNWQYKRFENEQVAAHYSSRLIADNEREILEVSFETCTKMTYLRPTKQPIN